MLQLLSQSQQSAFCLYQWQVATWQDYLELRNNSEQRLGLFFNQGWLWICMGSEGINHANISDLFVTLVLLWGIAHPEQPLNSFGRCQMEKAEEKACAPDLIVYLGQDYPCWKPGESRFINLDEIRSPDLVGEISDTTFSDDLTQKKALYASLDICEYWLIDVKNNRVFMFQLRPEGHYREITVSTVLLGLSMVLLEQALSCLQHGTNSEAAAWFAKQLGDSEFIKGF